MTTNQRQTPSQRQTGLILLGLGILLLLSGRGAGTGWLWVGAIAAAFLYAYARRGEPGLAVPGGILAGVATGILLEGLPILGTDGVFLIGLAGGFYLVAVLEPTAHRWALWPAGILAAIAGLSLLSQAGWLAALALVAGGAYLLSRGRPAPVRVSRPPAVADRLAAWRARLAAVEGRPTTDVLGNDQLDRLARERPASTAALAGILRADQIERYGQAVMAVLRA